MKDIRGLLKTNGLERIANIVRDAVKPSVRLTSTGPSEAAVTRLGGRPNLPSDIEWPHWNEMPLAFLAQIDLSILPALESCPLPNQGAIFFFHTAGRFPPGGDDPEERASAAVKFSTHALQEPELRGAPAHLEEDRQYRSVELECQAVEDSIPNSRDQVIQELELTPDEESRYAQVWEEWNYAWRHNPRGQGLVDLCHRVAGYPDVLQDDPRLQAQLASHGLSSGNSSRYEEGKKRGLWPGAKEWVLLLQVDSEDAAGMMWGDSGRIYYLIHAGDLVERRFENVWAVTQWL